MKSPLQWLLVASITMVSGISFSQTRYVSTTGSDVSNDCQTPGSPCGTINYAYSQALAEDTIKIAPGNYTLTSTLSLLQPVVIAALDPMDLPVITSSASDVISVNSDDVTIMNIHFEMGLTASTGLRGIVANLGDFDNLKVSGNVFESTNPISGTPNTNMVWGAFAISLVSTPGDVQNVTIEDNEIMADATSNVFGRGIFLGNGSLSSDGPGGSITGNTVAAYYSIQSVLNADDLLIEGNDLDGTILISSPRAGVVIDIQDNQIGNDTQMNPDSYYAVLELRSVELGDVNVTNNDFINYTKIGLLSEASKNVSVIGNTFTPVSTATDFISIMANTKLMTNGTQGNTYSDEITIQGNIFNGGAAGSGKAIEFADHYGVNTPAFNSIVIGGPTAIEKNTFDSNLFVNIELNGDAGSSTTYSLWAPYPATTMVPFSQDVNAYAIYNVYNQSTFAAVEAKNIDEVDNALLGKINLFIDGTNRYVSATGSDDLNLCTLPGSPCLTIGYALSVAAIDDSVLVAAGNYAQTSILTVNQNGLTITAEDENNVPVITTNQTTVFDINAADVSLNALRLEMGLTATTGKYGIVSTANNFDNLKLTKNEIVSTSPVIPYGMVWDAYAIRLNSNAGANTSVTIENNKIGEAVAGTNNIFGRGISLGSGSSDGPGGDVLNNTIMAYYTVQAIRSNSDITISGNTMAGIAMLNTPLAGSDIDFNNNDIDAVTPMSADSLYALIDVRGIELGTVAITGNNLTSYKRLGLLSMASKNVTVTDNIFSPATAADAFTSIMANTKLMTNGVQANTYSDAIYLHGNTFNAGATDKGTAIEIADHYGVNSPAFDTIAIGGSATAEKNTFDVSLQNYIVLNALTGASTTYPLWAGYPATTMKMVTQDVEALYIHNNYNLPTVGEVELKNIDSVDNSLLGKVILAYSFLGFDEVASIEAKLYPNPAINTLTIELTDLNTVADVTLVDLVGNVVYTSTINGAKTMDVSNLTSGVYVVRLNNNGQLSSTRFVKN
jgi:hypothetical protein